MLAGKIFEKAALAKAPSPDWKGSTKAAPEKAQEKLSCIRYRRQRVAFRADLLKLSLCLTTVYGL